jgi:hypothetical protein
MSKEEKNCLNCKIYWDREGGCEVCRWEDEDHPSLFYHITRSPEVLAEEFIHLEYDRSKDKCGFTSQYLEEIFIIEEQEGKNHEEKYFNARNKALAATVARLKEVEE